MRSIRKLAVGLFVALFLPAAAWASVNLVQQHYRWRNDDGSESSATWKARPRHSA